MARREKENMTNIEWNTIREDYFKKDKKAFTEENRMGEKILSKEKPLEDYLVNLGFSTKEIADIGIYKEMMFSCFQFRLLEVIKRRIK